MLTPLLLGQARTEAARPVQNLSQRPRRVRTSPSATRASRGAHTLASDARVSTLHSVALAHIPVSVGDGRLLTHA
eukprot:2871780-Rhodomonas_salina.1